MDQSAHCIYCGCTLIQPTRPAHIVPDGMGGRLTSTSTCCNDCNNKFSKLEGDACLRIAPIAALAGARRGDRSFIRAKISTPHGKFIAENRRLDELAAPPRARGTVRPLPARREDQIAIVVAMLRDFNLPIEALRDGRLAFEADAIEPAPVPEFQQEPTSGTLRWLDRSTRRLMVKMALEFLAYWHPRAARDRILSSAVRFSRYDDGENPWAAVDTETSASGIPLVEDNIVHGLEIWTVETSLFYRMTLFSEFRFVGILSEQNPIREFAAAYSFDITDPANYRVAAENRDGASLVRKSSRTRRRELDLACEKFLATSYERSERRQGRAPPPSIEDLYDEIAHRMKADSRRA